MKTTSIRQTISFSASPEKVYELIMDEKKHAAFTRSDASISTIVNGKFNVFDGYCHGYNIELLKDKKIVQAWHFAEDGWPDDHYSTCTFIFEKTGEKTKLIFLQENVPEQNAEALKEGWKEFYWAPMKAWLKNN